MTCDNLTMTPYILNFAWTIANFVRIVA